MPHFLCLTKYPLFAKVTMRYQVSSGRGVQVELIIPITQEG